MKKILFLTLYFTFRPRTGGHNSLTWERNMAFAFRLAEILRVNIAGIILGDSNSWTLHQYSKLVRLPGIWVVLGVPGWTWFEWERVFKSERFQPTLKKIKAAIRKGARVFWNNGGNHALRNVMPGFEKAMRYCRLELERESEKPTWCMDIWAVSKHTLRQFGPKAPDHVKVMNEEIARQFGPHVIKLSVLTDLEGTEDEWIIVSNDGIHYKGKFDRVVRIPLIREAAAA